MALAAFLIHVAPFGHHRGFGALGRRRLRLPAADQGPQRLVVVLARRLDDRDVGVALAEQAGGDGDAGRSAADDQDLVLGRDGHGVWSPRFVSDALVGCLPGAVAAQDVADIGEAVLPQQARGHRGPITSGAVDDRRPRGSSSLRRPGSWPDRDGDRVRDGAGGDLARIADVDDLQVGQRRRALIECLRGQPGGDPTSSRCSNIASNGRSR